MCEDHSVWLKLNTDMESVNIIGNNLIQDTTTN